MGGHTSRNANSQRHNAYRSLSSTKYCASPSISDKALPLSTAVLYPLIQGTDVRVLQFISIVSSNLSVLTLRDPGRAPRSSSDTPDGGLIGLFGGAPDHIEQRGRKPSAGTVQQQSICAFYN